MLFTFIISRDRRNSTYFTKNLQAGAVKISTALSRGNGCRLEVLDIPEVEGVDMPKPHEFLSAEQRDGSTLQAEEIYTETWEWLKKVGCAAKVSSHLTELFRL